MKNAFLLAFLTIVLFSSCSIDRRVYRRGFMIAESGEAEIFQDDKEIGMSDIYECKHDKEEIFLLTSRVSADFNDIVDRTVAINYKKPDSVPSMKSVSEFNEYILSRSVDLSRNTAHFEFPAKSGMIENDTDKIHPLLIVASIMSMGLAGLFVVSLINNITKGVVFPYLFPAANLLVVIIAILSFLSFFIGKKMVKRKPEKWEESMFSKISFVLLLVLGVIYILYFFALLFVIIFSLLL